MDHALGVVQSVGSLVASFADPPPNRKFDLDLGLKDQPKDIQDKHYKVMNARNPTFRLMHCVLCGPVLCNDLGDHLGVFSNKTFTNGL